jgi:coatomer protein complex subunit alpha (xenin)
MLETQRQRLVSEEPDNMSRNLDLAAFFTHCKLQPAHVQLALRSAMRVFAKAGNNSTAAVFARRLVDMKPADSKVVTQVSCVPRAFSRPVPYPLHYYQARSVITAGDRNPRDAIEVSYDHFSEFDICAASLSPIVKGTAAVRSPFSGAKYLPEYEGSVCRVDGISQIGLSGSGLRCKV